MAASKKTNPSPSTSETPLTTTERVLGLLAQDSAEQTALLHSIDASLKTIVAALPKPQGAMPFVNPTTFEPKEPQ